jgi:hypothetical protein
VRTEGWRASVLVEDRRDEDGFDHTALTAMVERVSSPEWAGSGYNAQPEFMGALLAVVMSAILLCRLRRRV